MNNIVTAIAALAAASGPAVAQTQPAAPTAAKPMTRAQFVAQSDSAFAANDANHDGFINVAELQAAQSRDLQRVQAAAQARLQAEFKMLDTNHDGQLSQAEFLAVARVRANETPQQMLQALDTNHDGKVSADEFRGARMQQFNKADANRDGVVTPQEAAGRH